MAKQYDLNTEDTSNAQVQDDAMLVCGRTEMLIPSVVPYTKEELAARIDEAEEQIARGETIDAEVFFGQMKAYITSRL